MRPMTTDRAARAGAAVLLACAAAAAIATFTPAAAVFRAAAAADAPPPPAAIAVFDLELENSSPLPPQPAELARLARIGEDFRAALTASGRYRVVDTGPVKADVARRASIRGCNGCELELGQRLGADLIAHGWVQKVSNLILNLNLVVEDARTGRVLRAGSADMRGNTDESWDRALRYLLRERVLKDAPPP